MAKKESIMKIWQESFGDPKEYVSMFFDKIYTDGEALTAEDPQGATVSSLLLRKYRMTFQGTEVPVSYIMGAATRRSQRGKGYMSELITRALRESAARGDMMCTLIPSGEALYYFYDRYGFSTVFYMKEQRFTSAHMFPVKGEFGTAEGAGRDELWEAFDRLQHTRPCYITHTRRQFDNILDDLKCDGGSFAAVTAKNEEGEGGHIAAMAWAVPSADLLRVTDVMGESAEARTAALHRLRELHEGLPVLLYGRPTDNTGGRLMPRGMARIVNAGVLLSAIAAAHPELKLRIRVTDHILPEVNSNTYVIKGGVCATDEADPLRGLDFDVTVDVLGDMAFSSPRTGEILGFPSVRPMISLMLD